MQPQTGSVGRQSKGFFRSLVDLSFTSLVTARVVKFIYVLSAIFMIVYVLFATVSLSTFVAGFIATTSGSQTLGVLAGAGTFIVLAPLLLVVAVTYVRVLLEIVIVLFRISDNTAEIAQRLRGNSFGPFQSGTPGSGDENG